MRTALTGLLLALLWAQPAAGASCKPDPQHSPNPYPAVPPLDGVLKLAQRYAGHFETKIAGQDCTATRDLKSRLSGLKSDPARTREAADQLANQLTIALASMQSAAGLTVAAAYLVQFDPSSQRATNLFGSVLHATNRFKDAATVLEVALTQAPGKNILVRLNLANVYLDLNRDAEAKKLLDAVIRLDPEQRAAYQALAVYWLKRGNLREFQNALLKASTFEGYTRRAEAQADPLVDGNEVKPGDSVAQMESKTAQLKDSIPLSTADLIDAQFPREAQAIRDKYGKLLASERLTLPPFPQVKTNSNRDYAESYPIIGEWQKVFADKFERFTLDEQYEGRIDPNASEAANEAQARAIGQEKVQEALQQAQDQMKFLQGMGVVDHGTVAGAMQQVQKTARQQGITLDQRSVDPENPPGWDSGGVFARDNYKNYLSITRSYETYIRRYFADYSARELDNVMVYSKKMMAAQRNHQDIIDRLQCDQPAAFGQERESNVIACLKENLRAKQESNQIGDTYYKLWVNLFIPQYTQKMKPMLEEYWAVSALYIRNMNDPAVMQREYLRVKSAILMQALTAAGSAGIGASFAFAGTTEDEEAALAAAIAAAEEEAKVKQPALAREYKVPQKDWVDWIGDNLNFEVGAQFMSVKITARSIEFDAWVFGPGGGFKADFVDGTLDTYIAASGKFKFGVTVAGYDAKIGGDATFAKYTSHWDFQNGKFSEGWGDTGAQVKGSLGPYLSAKGAIDVDAKHNIVVSGSAKAEVGPLSAVAKVKVDSQLQAKYSGELAASGSVHGLQTPDLSLKY